MSIANLSLSGFAAGPAYFSNVDAKDGSGRKLELATFKIVHNPRSAKEKDAPAIFVRVSVWGIQAQIARDRIQKGTFVSVSGPITSCGVAMDKDGKEVHDKTGATVVSLEMSARDLEVPRSADAATNHTGGGYAQSGNSASNSGASEVSAYQSDKELEDLVVPF